MVMATNHKNKMAVTTVSIAFTAVSVRYALNLKRSGVAGGRFCHNSHCHHHHHYCHHRRRRLYHRRRCHHNCVRQNSVLLG